MKVSVCMITYNHEEYIAEAIEGVIMQQASFTFELIIGEDCSTDRTLKICQLYAERFPNIIRLLPSEKNYGMVENFLRVLNECSGEYIAICEGDDYWTDIMKLQRQVAFLERNPDYSICFHNARILWKGNIRNNSLLCSSFQKKKSTIEDLILSNFIPTLTVLFRNIKYAENSTIFHKVIYCDWLLHILNAQNGAIGYIDECMAVYRVHSGGATSSAHFDRNKLLENYKKTIEFYNIIDEYFNSIYHGLIVKRIKYYSKLLCKKQTGNNIHNMVHVYKIKKLVRELFQHYYYIIIKKRYSRIK